MNKLLKYKKGYKGGIKGTKFSPKAEANRSQKVAKAPAGRKIKY